MNNPLLWSVKNNNKFKDLIEVISKRYLEDELPIKYIFRVDSFTMASTEKDTVFLWPKQYGRERYPKIFVCINEEQAITLCASLNDHF